MSLRPASARSRSKTMVIKSRCGWARSAGVTPICVCTSKSLIVILSMNQSQELWQVTQILANQVGLHSLQFLQLRVSGQDRASPDSSRPPSLDVMLHVSDEHGRLRCDAVFAQNP